MNVRAGNIYGDLPASTGGEQFLTLFQNAAVTIERIVSHSHGTPAGFWYDQPHNEWVMVLRGRATLEFEGGGLTPMKEGDYLSIPSHVKHRVHDTGPDTVWLAVHIKAP
jgi:cupin 2 domain-containing protein